MAEPIEFETERLRLRQWRRSDYTPFAALNADPRVMACYPNTFDRKTSDALARHCREQIANNGWGFWAVELKASGAFIGFVGLHIPKADLPFAPCVEIGWRLAHFYWGKGYATEAAKGALRIGFEQLGLKEIVSFTMLKNARSRAVMERLGMQQEVDTFLHPMLPEQSPLREHVLYRLSREQWQAQAGD